jgi:hypothetical protein
MQTTSTWNRGLYAKQLVGFVVFLFAVQIVRALVICRLWAWLQPPTADSPLWAWMDMAAFILVGVAILLAFRPSAASLGLRLRGASRLETVASISGVVLLLGLVASSWWLDPAVLLVNVSTVVILPLFEELIFRGWGWGRLEHSGAPQWLNWLVISFLFGLWHFGYVDIYALRVAPAWPEMNWGMFLLMKFLTTFVIGLVVGLPRWRTKRAYGALILHGLVNLFGR